MRVFYPISARFSDFINDEARSPSGWTMLWSVFSIAVLGVVLTTLPLFEGGAADRQHEQFSKSHETNMAVTRAKQQDYGTSTGSKRSAPVSMQDYIDAHRFVRHVSSIETVKFIQLSVVPVKSKVNAGRYL